MEQPENYEGTENDWEIDFNLQIKLCVHFFFILYYKLQTLEGSFSFFQTKWTKIESINHFFGAFLLRRSKQEHNFKI